MKAIWTFTISLAGALLLLFLLAEQSGWMSESRLSVFILDLRQRESGRLIAAALIMALLAGDLALPVPSSILMTLSGTLLGFHAGWLASLTGAMGSALAGFWICRFWGQAGFTRIAGKADMDRLTRFFERYGIWAILLSRSVPMLTEIISCLAGLSAMRARRFVLASLLGTWPLCMVYAWAGSRALGPAFLSWAVLPAFGLPAIGLGLIRVHEAYRGRTAISRNDR